MRFFYVSCWTGAPAPGLVAQFFSPAAALAQPSPSPAAQLWSSLQPWPAATSTHLQACTRGNLPRKFKQQKKRAKCTNILTVPTPSKGSSLPANAVLAVRKPSLPFQAEGGKPLVVMLPVTVFCGLNHRPQLRMILTDR